MLRFLPARKQRSAQRQPARFTPRLETLEDRLTPSAGALDPTFDGDGIAVIPVGWGYSHAVAVQADGKIVEVGMGHGSTHEFAVLRHNSDGSLDSSFGNGGMVFTDVGRGTDRASDVLIQPDGKILAVGVSMSANVRVDFALVRYNPNGTLDMTFGSRGKVTTSFSNQSAGNATSVARQTDGKIIVVGSSGGQLAVARYNTNGSLDTSFANKGKFQKNVGPFGADNGESDVAIQADGKIVISGGSLFRLTSAGVVDTSFGVGGYVPSNSHYVAIQGDGKILARSGGGLSRYHANGSLDVTFGSGGSATPAIAIDDITLQPDGKIVATGSPSSLPFGITVQRFNGDGSSDATFGTGGVVSTPPLAGSSGFGADVALQSDGKIVVAVQDSNLGNSFAVARYLGDGAALHAANLPSQASTITITTAEVQPLLTEALARWETAGADLSAFDVVDVRIADLGGTLLGLASGTTIWLDDNAAGWGWFVDATPWEDSEFWSSRGEQGMDLLSVLSHELGHMLGLDHDDDGVMSATLAAGTRLAPTSADLTALAIIEWARSDGTEH